MIEAENLTKYYGTHLAVENVSFQVNKGEIVGFLGPNGAGKTTIMRILVGFMPPSYGTARIAGHDILRESIQARKLIGYLPETVPLYHEMTVRSYLRFSGTLRSMSKSWREARIKEIIRVCSIEEYADTLIGKLSKGYRQRVGIAQAILHDPEVIILDEPTIGIDPRQVAETRQLIKNMGRERTVILSSHILHELSVICQKVIIINRGKVVAVDSPENLSAGLSVTQRIDLEILGSPEEVLARLKQIEGVREIKVEGAGNRRRYQVEYLPGKDMRSELVNAIVQKGWKLLELKQYELSLEDIFLKLTS